MNGALHHVEVNVSDLASSRAFYDWLLPLMDYSLYQQWKHGFSYKKGETYLVFVQTEEAFLEREYHRKATGLNHLAFHADPALIERVTQELALKGIPILYPDRHPYAAGENTLALFFEDPDRLKIELAAY